MTVKARHRQKPSTAHSRFFAVHPYLARIQSRIPERMAHGRRHVNREPSLRPHPAR